MFADLKNDFVFRRVFAHHPELTAGLLNELLGLEGDDRIVELALLSPEQAPVVAGAKLSILDLKACDRAGRRYVVEMQLLHVDGFLNRVVYNACKAYVGQLRKGVAYTKLQDVLAVSLCDFEIWPPRPGRPAVPLVSRWVLTEEQSGTRDLRQVQYVFVELPKVLREGPVETAAAQWAWLFRYGHHLDAMPPGLTEAQRQTLRLAEEATFTAAEAEAYQRVEDEIEQARQLAEDARRDGWEEGRREGKEEGLRDTIADLCEAYGIELSAERRRQLGGGSADELQRLRAFLKTHRRWPDSEAG